MSSALDRLRRQAYELAKANGRREAAHAMRDRAIRAARAGGLGVTAIAEAARLSRAGVYLILKQPYGGPPGDEESLRAATAEAQHTERYYAWRRWRRDHALLDALDAGASREDVALVGRIDAAGVRQIIAAGRTDKPRESYRCGRSGRTDWEAIRQRHRQEMAQRRADVRAGRREVAQHGRAGYDEGCRCNVCIEGRHDYDRARAVGQ